LNAARVRRRLTSIPVLVIVAVLLAAALMAGLTATSKATVKPCSSRPAVASVAVTPELAPAITPVAALFNREQQLVGQRCAVVRVVAAPPAAVAATLDGQASKKTRVPADAWIPDSSLWVDVARSFPAGASVIQTTGFDVAKSPLMLVMPPQAAARVPAFGASAGWSFLLPPSSGGPAASQKVRVDLPDPATSAAGLATLVQIGRLLGGGTASRTAFTKFVFESEATSQVPGPQGLTPFLTQAAPPLNGNPVTVTSEQNVLAWDRAHPSAPLAARYPLSRDAALGSPELDYPWVVTATRPAQRAVAAMFGKLLGQPYATGLVRYAGFRTGDNVADAAPRQFGLATQLLRIATPPSPSEAQGRLQAWRRLEVNDKNLALIDVSQAMKTPVAPGVTLEKEVGQAASLGLSLFPDGTTMGMWEYADKLAGAQPYRQLVSIGPLTGELGLISRRQQLVEASGSVKPTGRPAALNKAILAGYQKMQASYAPKHANALLVLTSGADNARDDISTAHLLAALHQLYRPAKPVEIVIIMFGGHGNFAAMRQISQATAGTAYQISSPAQIGQVFFEAIAQRICATSCGGS
jgi:Ca-activated chloride channel family protein